MAYSYEQFLTAANKAGLTNRFSKDELAAAQKSPEFGISLMGFMQDEQRATTEEQRLLAREAANQMRSSYGLLNTANTYGGTDPTAGVPQDNYAGLLNQTNTQSSYGGQTTQPGTQDNYAGLLNPAGTQGSFAYDPAQDPVWSAYKKQYAREGERASANAMAQAATMSGGIPSSYAVTAGQQAGNYYAGQMSDIIPELEQNAYQRFLYEQQLKQQEFDNALNLYNTLGYATPEIEKILGIEESDNRGGSGGSGSSGGYGGNGDNGDTSETTEEENLLAGMLEELEGQENQEPNADAEEVDTSNFKVTNRTGNGWVMVGSGRMTWTELEREVNQGRIIEVVDPVKGTITYKYA